MFYRSVVRRNVCSCCLMRYVVTLFYIVTDTLRYILLGKFRLLILISTYQGVDRYLHLGAGEQTKTLLKQ